MDMCSRCKIEYPEGLVNMIHTNDERFDAHHFCGICALEVVNIIHGIVREKFDGPRAESMRQKCIQWRKEHDTSKSTI